MRNLWTIGNIKQVLREVIDAPTSQLLYRRTYKVICKVFLKLIVSKKNIKRTPSNMNKAIETYKHLMQTLLTVKCQN